MCNVQKKFQITGKEVEHMDSRNSMMCAEEVATELSVSKGKAYKIIKAMNEELSKMGYIVISGKVPRAYWNKKFYGYESS